MQFEMYVRDWQSILDAILRVNSSTTVPILQTVSLECASILVPCTQATFFLSCDDGTGVELCRPAVYGMKADYLEEFLSGEFGYGDDSDWFFGGRHLIRRTETSRDSDTIPEEYLLKSRIYREMYVKQGIHYAMRSCLSYQNQFVGCIELFNSKERGDFDDKQLYTLRQLAPHIANRLGQLLEDEQREVSEPKEDRAIDMREIFHLTPREHELVMMILSGAEDAEIEDTLCISSSTFKKHLYNVYRKLDVSSRVQLYSKLMKL